MDGMLSQDEINALLSGMDLSGDTPPEIPEDLLATDTSQSSMPSNNGYFAGAGASTSGDETLSDVEKDAIGEVANISMGSSATTLYSLVNRKVNITTPVVELATWDSLLVEYEKPCVFTQIKYTVGLDGTNIMVLKERDVKIITDLMMGGDGTNIDGEITDLHLSAISEAMNQMMGSAATSLSTMLNSVIDISPPISSLLDLTTVKAAEEIAPFLGGVFVKISFRMQIDTLVDSTIMQLYPIDFAKKLVETFIDTQTGGAGMGGSSSAPEPAPAPAPAPTPSAGDMSGGMGMSMGGMQSMPDMSGMGGMQGMNGMQGMPGMDMSGMQGGMGMPMGGMQGMPGMPMGGMQGGMGMPMGGMQGMPGMPMGGMQGGMGMPMGGMQGGMGMPMGGMQGMPGMPMGGAPMQQNVNVQPAQFQSFSGDMTGAAGQENIGLIKDVPLEVTVELGRTTKSIAEILDFSPGTIIELDRIAGEPIDVLVNGKFVAKGEVVVIEESFGIRVTEIIK